MPRPLSLSIQDHLVEAAGRPWPIDWEAVFGRRAPLVLEIGFGNGQFLLEQALAHPERDHVGIELSWSGAIRLFKRLGKYEVRNARALLGDAELALQRLFSPASLEEVFVNHPCPWPKARHIGRRVLQPEFLNLLADRMRPGAKLTVVTDHAEYAVWLTEVLEGQDVLVSCHATTEVAEIEGRNPTKYQLKAMAQGIPIHFFEWRKERETVAPPPPPTDSNEPMPSLSLRGAVDAGQDLFAAFEPLAFQEELRGVRTIVRLSCAYRRTGTGLPSSWMVETLVQEDRLRQEFGLLVLRRKEGDVLVKLSGLGRPHPTLGVKRAVFALGQWLRDQHSGLEITHENLGDEATGTVSWGDIGEEEEPRESTPAD